MTTTRVYKSTDAGAPALTGQVSKMIDLLDAVLVNGYNSKTITITRTGDVATAACTAHGFRVEQVVLISGATPSDYNGEFRVLTAAADDFTFEVLGSPTTPATGTISCLVAPAGWTKPYTGTNKAAFQNSAAAGGSGMYLRVLDDGSATGGARDAMAWVYSAMTDVDTGTDITPSAAVMANGVFFRKSSTADSTARPWQVWADERTCYVWVEPVTSATFATRQSYLYTFGDFETLLAVDGYAFFISGNVDSLNSGSWAQGTRLCVMPFYTSTVLGNNTEPFGVYSPKRYQQDTGPQQIQLWAGIAQPNYASITQNYGSANAIVNYPDTGSTLKLFHAAYVVEKNCFRGRYRGLYAPLGNLISVSTASVVRETGITGLPPGSALDTVRLDVSGASSYRGYLAIESLLPWS